MAGNRTVTYTLRADTKEFTKPVKDAGTDWTKFVAQLAEGKASFAELGAAAGPAGVAIAAAASAAAVAITGLGAAVIQATAHAVAFGGHVSDLAAKTGISAEALQRLGNAASLTGGTMESASAAVFALQKNLANAPEHFADLGLNVAKLRQMAPDQLLYAVSDALRALPPGLAQTEAGIAVMGKQAQEHLPFLLSNVREASDRFEALGTVLSGQTVTALDNLGDEVTTAQKAWEGFQNQLGAAIAESPGVIEAVRSITRGIGDLTNWLINHKSDVTNFFDLISEKAGMAIGALRTVQSYLGLSSQFQGSLEAHAENHTTASYNKGASAAARKAEIDAEKEAAKIKQMIRESDIRSIKQVDQEIAQEYKANVVIIKQTLDEWVQDERETAEMIKAVRDQINRDGEDFMRSWQAQQQAAMQAKQDVINLAYSIADLGDVTGSKLVAGLGNAVAGFLSFNEAAFQANGAVQKVTVGIQALTNAYKSGSILGGAASGAGAGLAMFGPIGGIIGGIAGGIAGLFGHNSQQKKELAELKDQYNQLAAQARAAGIVLAQTFNPNSVQSYKQAIDQLNQALQLQGEADKALHEAMDKYGISISQLGPTFAKQELDKQAADLLKSYQLLTAAGVDHDLILQKMGGDINAYVNSAISSGTAIPEAMRPIIEDLIKHGELLDENGQAYTSVEQAGISFTQTMSEQFSSLIDKINQLVDALLGINNVHVSPTITLPGTNGGNEGEHPGLASGGIVNRPGVFRVGEANRPEAVIPLSHKGGGPLGMGEVQAEMKGLRADLRAFIKTLPKAMRDQAMMAKA